MSFIRGTKYEYLFEEPAAIRYLGGVQSLFRSALARGRPENEIRADAFEFGLREGMHNVEQKLGAAEQQGYKSGRLEGQIEGAKNFAIHGGKYLVASGSGFHAYRTVEELKGNQEFRQEVAKEVGKRKQDDTPKLIGLHTEEGNLQKAIQGKMATIDVKADSFKTALEHIRTKANAKYNQEHKTKGPFLQDIIQRNQNLETLEGKQQLYRDVLKYQSSYAGDWKRNTNDMVANMKDYFNHLGDLEGLQQKQKLKQAEITQERQELQAIQEKRRQRILTENESAFSTTLSTLNVNFNKTPFFLSDTVNIYNIEKLRANETHGFQDWRTNKGGPSEFKKTEDYLFVPKSTPPVHITTKEEIDAMVLSSTQKFMNTPAFSQRPKVTLREELKQTKIPLLAFGPPETPPIAPVPVETHTPEESPSRLKAVKPTKQETLQSIKAAVVRRIAEMEGQVEEARQLKEDTQVLEASLGVLRQVRDANDIISTIESKYKNNPPSYLKGLLKQYKKAKK